MRGGGAEGGENPLLFLVVERFGVHGLHRYCPVYVLVLREIPGGLTLLNFGHRHFRDFFFEFLHVKDTFPRWNPCYMCRSDACTPMTEQSDFCHCLQSKKKVVF